METKVFPEIPTCTICLEELANELSVTKCGHVFHTICIEQSLEIRSSCPNCKARVIPCQVHNIIYSIGNVSAGKNAHLKFIEELTKEEQKEFTKLVDKNEDLFKENNKLQSANRSLKLEVDQMKVNSADFEKKYNEIKGEKEKFEKEAENFKNKKKSMKILFQNNELEKKELFDKVAAMEKEQKDCAALKLLRAKMTAEEDEYIKVIREKHSIQEQAKIFYETVLLKKTEMKNLKKEIENGKTELKTLRKFQIFYEDKTQECERLKRDLERQKELSDKYKLQAKERKEKSSNEEKSNKINNENNSTNFEFLEDIENINISNRNITRLENNKVISPAFVTIEAIEDNEFNMEYLIEKPEEKNIFNFEQKPSLRKDITNKISEINSRRIKNALFTHNNNLKNEDSPTFKRQKFNSTKSNSLQFTLSKISFSSQPQQSLINSFLFKK